MRVAKNINGQISQKEQITNDTSVISKGSFNKSIVSMFLE